MTNKELLVLAAKAAGIAISPDEEYDWRGIKLADGPPNYWNPLTDDGDALHLAVKLKIDLMFSRKMLPMHAHLTVTAWVNEQTRVDEFLRSDANAAVRRAVVRAAAEIGKATP